MPGIPFKKKKDQTSQDVSVPDISTSSNVIKTLDEVGKEASSETSTPLTLSPQPPPVTPPPPPPALSPSSALQATPREEGTEEKASQKVSLFDLFKDDFLRQYVDSMIRDPQKRQVLLENLDNIDPNELKLLVKVLLEKLVSSK